MPDACLAAEGRWRPVTAAQRDLWLIEQEKPGDVAYNVPFAVWVDGPLDITLLEACLAAVAERHDALRTVFRAVRGEPVAGVVDAASPSLPVVCVRSDAEALEVASHLVRLPFDPDCPRLRAGAVAVGADRHLFLLVLHHSICDASSLWILMAEVAERYTAAQECRSPDVGPAPSAAVAHRLESAAAESGRASRVLNEIVDQVGSAPDVLDLSYDRWRDPAGREEGPAGKMVEFELPRQVAAAVATTARRLGVTENSVLLAAYTAVLEAVTGIGDFLVSIPVTRRRSRNLRYLVGYLVQSVPVRLTPQACRTGDELIRHCGDRLTFAWTHSAVSFGQVVAAVQPHRVPGLNPLCQAEFSTQRLPAVLPRLGPCTLRYQFVHNQSAKFSLSLETIADGDRRRVAVEYRTDLFRSETVERLGDLYLTVLKQITSGGGLLDEMALTSPGDGCRSADCAPGADRSGRTAAYVSLLDRVESVAARQPGATAILDRTGSLTYRELSTRACAMAASLAAAGVVPGDRIAVRGERTAEVVITALAAMKRGASFVMLADDTPPARVARILAAARPAAVVVTATSILGQLPADERRSALTCDVGRLIPVNDIEHGLSPGEAYAVFTSGSTGEPRGVSVPATALAAITAAWGAVFGLEQWPGRHLQMAPISFDVFVGDLARALGFGGTLVIASREDVLDPRRLLDVIEHGEVDTAEFVPAVSRLVTDYLEHVRGDLRRFRRVMVGSDAWPVSDARRLRELLALEAKLYCTYGTSEATIDSTYHEVTATTLPPAGTVPIGRPFPGIDVSVRDRRGRVLPAGMPGELWISGPTVASGYFTGGGPGTDAAVSAAKFSRAGNSAAPDRSYRTGDKVFCGPAGCLTLTGRIDNELKVRGVRVQPGEIESILCGLPPVREAAVVATRGRSGEQSLTAFLVGPAPGEIAEIAAAARSRLLGAAVPAFWQVLETLPLTRNGKVDRNALRRMAMDMTGVAAVAGSDATPAGSLETAVLGLWREILAEPRIGVLDDFYAMGGCSVQAARLAWRISTATGLPASVADILRAPSVRELCRVLSGRGSAPGRAASLLVKGADSKSLDDLSAGVLDFLGLAAAAPATRTAPPRTVLLAGATGTLGPGILRELLAADVEAVICLLREPGQGDPRDRLRTALARYGADPGAADDDRVHVCRGDLARPTGLDDSGTELIEDVEAVVNAAAWVNFLYPYELLAPVNVGGVARLADLGARAGAGRLHHLSSQSAIPPSGQLVHGGYNQTKAVAERVLIRLRAAGFPVSVYRPGFVIGRPRSAAGRPGLLEAFARECVRTRLAPQLDGCLQVVSADHVAAAVVQNMMAAMPLDEIDLAGMAPLPWSKAWDAVRGRGVDVRMVPAAEWLSRLAGDLPRDSWFEPFLPLCREVGIETLIAEPGGGPSRPSTAAEDVAEVWSRFCGELIEVIPA